MKKINLGEICHTSVRQRAEVSDRGAGFGDIYLYDRQDQVEGRFCWTAAGDIWAHGSFVPTSAQKSRAVRALAETAVGRGALHLGETYDPNSVPSADEAELEQLKAAARAAGLTLADDEASAAAAEASGKAAAAAVPAYGGAAATPFVAATPNGGVTVSVQVGTSQVQVTVNDAG